MHNIKTNFDKILVVIKDILSDDINEKGNYLRRGTTPRFSDLEVIALSLTAECLSIDSENYLFSKLNKEYKAAFENMISRRQYNDRRKVLFEKTERVRYLRSLYCLLLIIFSNAALYSLFNFENKLILTIYT